MFPLRRDEVDSDTSVCCTGFFGENFPRNSYGWVFGGGGGGRVDSDTWPSCKATSCFGQLFRLLVSRLNVLPLIGEARRMFQSLLLPHQSCQHELSQKRPDSARWPKRVVAGTQCIDRFWQTLEEFVPHALHSKNGPGNGVKETLLVYVHAFLWRVNLPEVFPTT